MALKSTHRWDAEYSARIDLFGMNPTKELLTSINLIGEPGTALDAGCGNGRDTIALLRYGYQVVAMDSSSGAIDALQTLAARYRLPTDRLDAKVADVVTFNCGVEQFDVVNCVTLLDHLSSELVGPVIEKLLRATRIGGTCVFQVLTTEDPAVTGKGSKSEFATEIDHYFAPNELLRFCIPAIRVIYYEERMEWDFDHGEPHQHAMAVLVGTKHKGNSP